MKRNRFRSIVFGVAFSYLVLAVACIATKLLWCGAYYDLVKDVSAFVAALPAAVLAGAYQMRTSFLQQLRELWKNSLDAVQDAIQFTYLTSPTPENFSSVMKKLSVAIDDVRSLYRNLEEGEESIGYYPFEGLKSISSILGTYYLEKDYTPEIQAATRSCISRTWKNVRRPILAEFDRPTPSHHDSPFV